MKIAVINFSGNVGKSTLTKHVLLRSLQGAKLVTVESINTDELGTEAIRGKEFGELSNALVDHEHVIVDVGASNVEDFLERMRQYNGSHEDFDLFLVPSVPSKKQQVDTISTVNALSDLGVEPNRIRVVLNRVEPNSDPQRLFGHLFSAYEFGNAFTLKPLVILQENELYGQLQGRTLRELLEDPTDFAQKIKEATTKEERLEWSKRRGLKRLATGVAEELDRAFALLVEGV